MSFQIFLDSIIDLINETITFINWSCICRLANLEFTYLLTNFYFDFTSDPFYAIVYFPFLFICDLHGERELY